jgi:hypothetical protein
LSSGVTLFEHTTVHAYHKVQASRDVLPALTTFKASSALYIPSAVPGASPVPPEAPAASDASPPSMPSLPQTSCLAAPPAAADGPELLTAAAGPPSTAAAAGALLL